MGILMVFVVLLAIGGIYAYRSDQKARKRRRRKKAKKPRDIKDELLDLEFCPGMTGTFDILNSQRRRFMRVCSRWATLRTHVKDWRADVVVEAIEEADKVLEYNIGQIIGLVVAAGYNPKWGFYQPEFDRSKINTTALKSYAAENAEILEELDDLITSAVEYSWVRAETTAINLRSWTKVLSSVRAFEEDFVEQKAS